MFDFLSIAVIASAALVVADTETCPPPSANALEVRFAEEEVSPTAIGLEAMAWFEGRWVGSVFGLNVEHTVLAEVGDQMPGLVRLHNDEGEIVLYELSAFLMQDGQLAYRNRLFDGQLSEQPTPTGTLMTRRAVTLGENVVYFDGITFAHHATDCAAVSFVLPGQDAEPMKHTVHFRRLD